jgi:hypothetical protein
MRRDRMRRLEQLRTGDDCELPPRLEAEIAHELRCLELILGCLKGLRRSVMPSHGASGVAERCGNLAYSVGE